MKNTKTLIAAGSAVAVLFALGTWQVVRLQWKNDLQASLNAAYEQDKKPEFLSAEELKALSSSHVLRGKLKGRLLLDDEITVGPKKDDAGRNAYDVVTPMRLENGDVILINRGKLFTESFTDPRPTTGESGSIEAVITGLVQPSPHMKLPFMAENNPEKDVWLIADADDIAEAKELENMRPIIMHAERSSVAKDRLEMRDPVAPQLRNDHLQYAIFWYLMGLILIVISYLRLRKSNPDT